MKNTELMHMIYSARQILAVARNNYVTKLPNQKILARIETLLGKTYKLEQDLLKTGLEDGREYAKQEKDFNEWLER